MDCPLIWSIVVAAAHRGSGIGSKLMSSAEEFYKGKKIYLHVEPRNRAVQFYAKRGYIAERLIEDFYGPSFGAIEMSKTL